MTAGTLHPQLQQIVEDYRRAEERLHALSRAVPADAWFMRLDPAKWSVGECVVHLNLTSAHYIPILREAIGRAPKLAAPSAHRYKRDVTGWLLWRIMPPPVRLRMPTAPRFVPTDTSNAGAVIAEFVRLQAEQIACVEASNGLAIDKVYIVSPFNERVKYNLFSCFGILPRHEHRHLWQAEQALQTAQLQSAGGAS